jgi:chaperonin GroES
MLRPLRGMVIIQPEAEESESASGLILSTNTDKQTSYGKVLSLAEDVTDLAVNDRVLYNRFMADEVKDGEVELMVVPENEILCVIE